GVRVLPPLEVLGPQGKVIARTEAWSVEAASAISADDPDPATPEGALPPMALPFPWQYAIAAGVLAALLLAGLVFLVLRLSRRTASALPPLPAGPARPEHEVALA